MSHVWVCGAKLYYEERGAGAPMVFVHGHHRDGRDWAAQAEFFGQDYRVLVPDLRFHGLSDATPIEHHATITDLAVDLHGLLQALAVARPVLVGHSLGGMILLDHARLYPDEATAYAFIDSFPYFAQGSELGLDLFCADVDETLKNRIMEKSLLATQNERVPPSVWSSVLAFDARPWMARISVPTLACLGDRGRFSAAEMADIVHQLGYTLLPDLATVTFERCGHFIAQEQPRRLNRVLLAFVKRCLDIV